MANNAERGPTLGEVILARRNFLCTYLPPRGHGWFDGNPQAAEDLFDSLSEEEAFSDNWIIGRARAQREDESLKAEGYEFYNDKINDDVVDQIANALRHDHSLAENERQLVVRNVLSLRKVPYHD